MNIFVISAQPSTMLKIFCIFYPLKHSLARYLQRERERERERRINADTLYNTGCIALFHAQFLTKSIYSRSMDVCHAAAFLFPLFKLKMFNNNLNFK